MKVVVRLFGGIKTEKEFLKSQEGDIVFEFFEPITLAQLIEFLTLNKKPFIVVINGVITHDFSIQIKDGDEIALFPPIAGGKD